MPARYMLVHQDGTPVDPPAPRIPVFDETKTIREIARTLRAEIEPLYTGVDYCSVSTGIIDARAAQDADTCATIIAAGLGRKAHHGEGIYLQKNHVYNVRPEGGSIRFEAFSVPTAIGLQILELTRQKTEGA